MKIRYICVIHTSPATIDVFGRLLRERVPHARVSNLLDDSILPELRDNGGDVAAVAPRWREYAKIARDLGADVVLNACSSIGELCEPVARELSIPIVRVDSAMAREAVARGQRVAVVATMETTLRPTRALIVDTARRDGRNVEVGATLVEGAYAALVAGDQSAHDDRVAAALIAASEDADAVVLAQASMARVLPRLDPGARAKCLISPPLAVADVVEAIARL